MKKNRLPLDIYDFELMPRSQKIYIMQNGYHFTKEAYMYAASLMRKSNKATGKEEKVPVYTKEEVDALLKKYNVEVSEKGNYDYVYAAQMCRADYLGDAVPDDQRLALYIKQTCDDVDAADGVIFRCWLVKMVAAGEAVDFSEFIEE